MENWQQEYCRFPSCGTPAEQLTGIKDDEKDSGQTHDKSKTRIYNCVPGFNVTEMNLGSTIHITSTLYYLSILVESKIFH